MDNPTSTIRKLPKKRAGLCAVCDEATVTWYADIGLDGLVCEECAVRLVVVEGLIHRLDNINVSKTPKQATPKRRG